VSITPRRAALVTPLLLLGLALNGCGIADNDVRPGVAARVDGTTVSLDDVDDTVANTCAYLDDKGQARLPLITVRRLLLETMVRRVAAERLLDDYDTELPDTYTDSVGAIDAEYADLPAGQARAMREGSKAAEYVSQAGDAIGSVLLRKESGAEAGNSDEISARGVKAIDDWLADHDVSLNPTFGLRVDKGTFVADDGLSVPVSTEAALAQDVSAIDLRSADQAALGASIEKATKNLPEDEVCGPAAAG
jgi:hypothetical protein